METKSKTCEERIFEEMQNRENEIAELMANPELDEQDDIALSIDTKKITTICFSWGGPADYLEIVHDSGEIHSVTYRFSDWGDTATREVLQGSPLYDYALNTLELLGE